MLGREATTVDVYLGRVLLAGVGEQTHRAGRRKRKEPDWDVAPRWNQHVRQQMREAESK